MSGFDVSPKALDAYADVIGSANSTTSVEHGYLLDADPYLDQWVKLEDGGGGLVFSALAGKTEELRAQISGVNDKLITTMIESAQGLTDSADAYRKTDHANATKLDQAYKPAGVDVPEGAPDTSTPAANPAAVLVAPSSEGAVPEPVEEVLHFADWYSVSGLVLKILGWCGFHPVDKLNEWLFGDVEAVARVKNAIENLAKYDEQAAANVTDGLGTLMGSWSGTAASAAEAYFEKLADAIEQRQSALEAVATRYNDVATGIQQAGEALGDALSLVLDSAAEAAAAVAAAGCLQEIPGVDVLADVIGAAKVAEVYEKISDFTKVWVEVWSGSEGLLGLITGLAGILPGYDIGSSIPTMAYHNASQGPAPAPAVPGPGPTRGRSVAQ